MARVRVMLAWHVHTVCAYLYGMCACDTWRVYTVVCEPERQRRQHDEVEPGSPARQSQARSSTDLLVRMNREAHMRATPYTDVSLPSSAGVLGCMQSYREWR